MKKSLFIMLAVLLSAVVLTSCKNKKDGDEAVTEATVKKYLPYVWEVEKVTLDNGTVLDFEGAVVYEFDAHRYAVMDEGRFGSFGTLLEVGEYNIITDGKEVILEFTEGHQGWTVTAISSSEMEWQFYDCNSEETWWERELDIYPYDVKKITFYCRK